MLHKASLITATLVTVGVVTLSLACGGNNNGDDPNSSITRTTTVTRVVTTQDTGPSYSQVWNECYQRNSNKVGYEFPTSHDLGNYCREEAAALTGG